MIDLSLEFGNFLRSVLEGMEIGNEDDEVWIVHKARLDLGSNLGSKLSNADSDPIKSSTGSGSSGGLGDEQFILVAQSKEKKSL